MGTEEIRFFNQLANSWDSTRSQDEKKLEKMLQLIGINEGDDLLDLGCGTGVLLARLSLLAGKTGSVTAVDFAENMIRLAREKHKNHSNIRYVVSDILTFQPDKRFDKVICLNFYPHIKEKEAFLAQMCNLLKENGCLIIMHDISRQAVNAIHGESKTVAEDRLEPAAREAIRIAGRKFVIKKTVDDDSMYFIAASRCG